MTFCGRGGARERADGVFSAEGKEKTPKQSDFAPTKAYIIGEANIMGEAHIICLKGKPH